MACKEVFLLMNNLKEAIIACHHVRALHATCALYVQLFEHYEFEEYLSQPPFRATTCACPPATRCAPGMWPE